MADSDPTSDLVKLLFTSTLFSRNSERLEAIRSTNDETNEDDCRLIVELGKTIHPAPRRFGKDVIKKKNEELEKCLATAEKWLDKSSEVIPAATAERPMSYSTLNQRLERILTCPYLGRTASKPVYLSDPMPEMMYFPNIGVFWDYQLCPIPDGFDDIYNIRDNIKESLTKLKFVCEPVIFSIGDKWALDPVKRKALEIQSTLVDAPNGNNGKVTSDKQLIVEILKWAESHTIVNNEATVLVAITNDPDFRYVLTALKERGFYVVMVYGDKSGSLRLKNTSGHLVEGRKLSSPARWSAFIRGELEI